VAISGEDTAEVIDAAAAFGFTVGFTGARGTENTIRTTPTPQIQMNVDRMRMDFDAIDVAERMSTEDSIVPAL
jgi:hypothetical protein